MVSFTPRPPYPQGKSTHYPLDMRLGGPQSRSGHGAEQKNSQPSPGIELAIPLHYVRLIIMACNFKDNFLGLVRCGPHLSVIKLKFIIKLIKIPLRQNDIIIYFPCSGTTGRLRMFKVFLPSHFEVSLAAVCRASTVLLG
jgi:hypothetical protein